jgi:hemerythrin-like domain-containing protein
MQAGIPMNGGPLGVMLYEHDKARQLLREMEQALADKHPADFALYANRYAQLLEDHIAREDNILFAKAEDVLTREDDEALLERFNEIENEISEDTHERFHHMLDTLASHYVERPAKAS